MRIEKLSWVFKASLIFTLINAVMAVIILLNSVLNGENLLYDLLYVWSDYCFPIAVMGILTTFYAYLVFDSKPGKKGIPGKWKILMWISYIPALIAVEYIYINWYEPLL